MCEPIARKAGLPAEAVFLVPLEAVIDGVGIVLGVGAGGTLDDGSDEASDMVAGSGNTVSGRSIASVF